MKVASFSDSTPQLFIAIHSVIKSWGVESGNEANNTQLGSVFFRSFFTLSFSSSILDDLHMRLLSFQFYAWWFNYPGSLIHTKLGVARLIVFEGRWGMHD